MSINQLKIVKASIEALKGNKTRTALSVAGIVIGVASVIVIVSIGEGLKSLVTGQLNAFSPNLMMVEVKIPGADYDTRHIASIIEGVVITTLKESDVQAIRDKKRFPYVRYASGYSSAQEWAKYREKEKRILILASDSYYPHIDGQMKIEKGRFFMERENESLARVVVIGSDVAEKLFGSADPVGKYIKIKQINFKVVGVLKKRGAVMAFNMDEVVLIPIRTAQKLILGINHIVDIGIYLKDKKYFPRAREEITSLLRQRHHISDPKNDDFQILSLVQILETINSITGAISLLLGILAAISLLVGGVGIMNIMLVGVAERTKEIGLRRALGAKRKDILLQFVYEAALISLAGGVVGVVFGISISFFIVGVVESYGFDWPFVVSYNAVVVSFLASAFFGIVFGWYPARKAARLNPIEALRYE